jgi:hypothetical protein
MKERVPRVGGKLVIECTVPNFPTVSSSAPSKRYAWNSFRHSLRATRNAQGAGLHRRRTTHAGDRARRECGNLQLRRRRNSQAASVPRSRPYLAGVGEAAGWRSERHLVAEPARLEESEHGISTPRRPVMEHVFSVWNRRARSAQGPGGFGLLFRCSRTDRHARTHVRIRRRPGGQGPGSCLEQSHLEATVRRRSRHHRKEADTR